MDPLKMPNVPTMADLAARFDPANLPPPLAQRTNELLQMLLVEQIETNQLLKKLVERADA